MFNLLDSLAFRLDMVCGLGTGVTQWGRPPGLRPTPSSAFAVSVFEQPDHGVRRRRGRLPHSGMQLLLMVQLLLM